jgi:hypothetical protein
MRERISATELDILIHELKPESPRKEVLFLEELDSLYHLRTGEHLVGSRRERLKRGCERNKEALLEALIQIAEKDIKRFESDAKEYPRFRKDCEEKINKLEKFIRRLRDC